MDNPLLNTWDILIAKIDVQRIVQCKPKDLQVVTECPRRRTICILNALNVLIRLILWVPSFLLAAAKIKFHACALNWRRRLPIG